MYSEILKTTAFVITVLCSAIYHLAAAANGPYTVYRLTPNTQEQLRYLEQQYLNNSKIDFWKDPGNLGSEAHVMLSPATQHQFLSGAKLLNMTMSVMIDDVEQVIKQRNVKADNRTSTIRKRPHSRPSTLGTRLRDAIFVGSATPAFELAQYHSFNDVINYLNALSLQYPNRVQVMPIGTTHEGRQIPLIKIGTQTRANKPGIWVDGGIHAREWVSPATVLFMVAQLATTYDWDPRVKQMVDDIDWYMVPLLNPDGYEHSRSSTDPEVRLWRKNKSARKCPLGNFNGQGCCQGVDLNRNFDWHWGSTGSSTDPCSEIYQGESPFSEPETRAVRDFVSARTGSIRSFLTLHSYSQILMYPYGHQQGSYPSDLQDMRSTALAAAQALGNMYGTQFKVGTGADTLYPASGGSEDWAKGKLGVKYSYLFELRPEEHVWDGFLLDESQILPTARETFEAVKIIADSVSRTYPAGGSASVINPSIPPQPTTTGATCRDLDDLCPYWAQNGACTLWSTMRTRCALSCGFCFDNTTTFSRRRKPCVDTRSDCQMLRNMRLCEYVAEACQNSCGLC